MLASGADRMGLRAGDGGPFDRGGACESADDERSSYGVYSDAGGHLQNDDVVYALRSFKKKPEKNSCVELDGGAAYRSDAHDGMVREQCLNG